MSLPDDLPIQTDAALDAGHDPGDWATQCEAAGLAVRIDAAGHVFARWSPPSADPAQPAVGTGAAHDPSDRDSTLGLHGGLEAIRVLQRVGHEPRRPIEVARLASADETGWPENAYHAWVRLRSDASGKLDKQNASVGIAMSITGSAVYTFQVTGEDGDAGALPMPERRDALCAAAETIHAIEQFARSSPSLDLTATVGRLDLTPDTPGRIPSQVRFVLELHDTEADNRAQVVEAIHQECNTIALRRDLKITSEPQHQRDPAACDKLVIDAIETACDAADLRWWKMVSGSTPDTLGVARAAPVGMVLIPGRDAAHVQIGVEALARTLAELANL